MFNSAVANYITMRDCRLHPYHIGIEIAKSVAKGLKSPYCKVTDLKYVSLFIMH